MAPTNPVVRCCCSAVKWGPVIFITAVVCWSYYAYVIQMCILTIPNTNIAEKVIYLILYHPLLFMFAWSYWQTIFAQLGKVPKEFYLGKEDVERFEAAGNEELQREILAHIARNLPVQTRTASGAIRYCEKCKAIKPDRCHHCSMCSTCVLKMDHHCPWVNNCVGFTNYKFFVQFLGYALIYCFYVAATSLQYFIKFWTGGAGDGLGKFHILFLFFVSIMFGLSLISLFSYHLYLVMHNRSTLESFRSPVFRSGPDKDGFGLGKKANFIEIFGDSKKGWFLPIFSSFGDGVSFPTRSGPVNSYQTMGSTTPKVTPSANAPATESTVSMGDGVTYPTRNVDLDSDCLLAERQRWMEEGEVDQPNGSTVFGP
ncbi:palmitoyltransferase ZDHHC20-B-like isoform X2 [Liolophura sinensis]|uniref:palmitoyltransferase ZDHHC20-B-like isoform X2 n=1 Tax=Liolophura sinensis TaxID=3198878 RepID=UPI0031590BB6